jgi:hypothetical protein
LHRKHILKLCMYSDNPLHFDGICVLCIEVKHDQTCSESIQCSYSAEAECVSGKCQCKSNFNYNGELCVGSVGMYNIYSNNIISNAVFSALLLHMQQLQIWYGMIQIYLVSKLNF